MRKTLRILSGFLVMAVFLTATMGFSVHYCAHEKTPHVLLLYGGGDCGHIHDHTYDQENHDDHDKDCCNTQVFSIHDLSLKGSESHTPKLVKTITPPDLFQAVMAKVSEPTPGSLFLEKMFRTGHRIPSSYVDNDFAPLRL